jgi:hypothetical protein
VKDSTYHRVDYFGATQALHEFLTEEHLDRDEIMSTGSWWIDIGVQVISADKDCLAYRTDSHRRIVQEICKITADQATRLTSIGSSKYTRDMTSHLPQISGCRIEPGVRGQGPYEVAYLQLYCTDKSITYRQDQGRHGKFITCSDVLSGKADNFINGLYSLYLNAIDNNYAHARMEVRVPVQYATDLLLDLNDDVIRGGLVSFPSVEWWYALFMKLSVIFANKLIKGVYVLTAQRPYSWYLDGRQREPGNCGRRCQRFSSLQDASGYSTGFIQPLTIDLPVAS